MKPRLEAPILVQKYGGSSVASPEHLRRVARRVVANKRAGRAVVVVVSAMGKTTDQLVSLANELHEAPPRREMDMLLHAGEIISASLLAMAIEKEGEPAVSFTGAQAGMITDQAHTQARVREVQGERILAELCAGRIVVITGFQGISATREVTTLGRGGSDTSAVAFAVGIGASQCEILTDVDGVYTADPRIVERPRRMPWVSYDEMLELASLGSKVLHPRSVEIARRYNVPIVVLSSFQEVPGTWICSEEWGRKEFGVMEDAAIRGVAHNGNVCKLSMVDVPDEPGVAAKIFSCVAAHNINIHLIVQAEHYKGRNDVSFLIDRAALAHVRPDVEALTRQYGAELVVDDRVATVSAVGDGVKSEPGIAARMFAALAREGINIDLISTSNLTVTCVVDRDDLERAVRAVHAEFLE